MGYIRETLSTLRIWKGFQEKYYKWSCNELGERVFTFLFAQIYNSSLESNIHDLMMIPSHRVHILTKSDYWKKKYSIEQWLEKKKYLVELVAV